MKKITFLLLIALSTFYLNSCERSNAEFVDVTTGIATVNGTSVVCEGYIEAAYTCTIPERGICYSHMNNTPNKNVDYYVSTDGGRGAFSCTLSNLLPSRTYYYRAYAKDSHGTLSYGETHSFNTGTSSNGEEENNSDEYQSLRFNINDLCGYWRAIAAYRNDTTYTPLGNDYHELKSSLEYFNEFVHNKGYGYVIEGYWMLNSDNYYTVTETIYADFDASHHYSNGQDIYRTNQWKVKELRKYNDGRLYLLMTGGTWRVLGGARCDMIIYEYISSKRVIEQTKQHTLNEIDMKKIKNIFPTNNIVNINKAYKINE